jgi:bifunctional DNA-binding transcriptional regulator/antitoxin component of YhaV-PrlF toxin-antitoxin module
MKLGLINKRQFFITLPNSIVKAKGWVKGDIIEATIDNKGNIVLRKQEKKSEPEPSLDKI